MNIEPALTTYIGLLTANRLNVTLNARQVKELLALLTYFHDLHLRLNGEWRRRDNSPYGQPNVE